MERVAQGGLIAVVCAVLVAPAGAQPSSLPPLPTLTPLPPPAGFTDADDPPDSRSKTSSGKHFNHPTITLGETTRETTPDWRGAGVVGLEKIEVTSRPAEVKANLVGGVYAHCYAGRHSRATVTMRLEQPFEVAPRDADDPRVTLRLEAKLDGYLQSAVQGSAGLRTAEAAVFPEGLGEPVLAVVLPSAGTWDERALRCQRKEETPSRTLPTGRYVLVARFSLEAAADGFCRGHAAAVFAPGVRRATWDFNPEPFKDVKRKDFGLNVTLKAKAPEPKKQ